jgi:crossover junction endodeoxyribonuclease RuvC
LQVKQAITSYGRAGKRQVQEMARALLNLRGVPRPDDGLATAVTQLKLLPQGARSAASVSVTSS